MIIISRTIPYCFISMHFQALKRQCKSKREWIVWSQANNLEPLPNHFNPQTKKCLNPKLAEIS